MLQLKQKFQKYKYFLLLLLEKVHITESEKDEPLVDDRKLTEEELISHAQESSQLRLPTASGTLSRSTSSNILSAAVETKRKKAELTKQQKIPEKSEPQRYYFLKKFVNTLDLYTSNLKM